MAEKSGYNSLAGVKIATIWGTAVAAGATNKLVAEISPNMNATTIVPRQIGSGSAMTPVVSIGGKKPTAALTGDVGYRNNFDVILAQFFGTAATPTEVTASQSDYLHVITLNTTINSKYLTVAYEDASATAMEFTSAAVRSMTIKTTSIPGLLEWTAELLCSDLTIGSVVNTNATLANVTLTDTELCTAAYDDLFELNLQSGGSLSSSDKVSITSFELQMTRPQDFVDEIKGATGLSAPRDAGVFTGSLTVGLKNQVDHTYWTAFAAETIYKAAFDVEGTQIGTGTNKTIRAQLPGLQLVTPPQYNLTQPGVNPSQLTFQLVKATSTPTGMTNTYPHFKITNGLATSLLA